LWSGKTTNYEDYLKTYWTGVLGSEDAFNAALQDGVKEDATAAKEQALTTVVPLLLLQLLSTVIQNLPAMN
jgi:hypothetical protein